MQESNDDEDPSSGGALVLPGLRDAFGRLQHLAVGAGKDSSIYVVDRVSGETSFFAEARVLVDQGIAWRESAEGGKKRRRWHAVSDCLARRALPARFATWSSSPATAKHRSITHVGAFVLKFPARIFQTGTCHKGFHRNRKKSLSKKSGFPVKIKNTLVLLHEFS